MSYPRYLSLFDSGELHLRATSARERLLECNLCSENCGANRIAGEVGCCLTSNRARLLGASPRFGVEEPLVGTRGSGAIFFASCPQLASAHGALQDNQQCNSHEVEPEDLAAIMLDLQEDGCHNLDLVSPSHVVPMILDALAFAIDQGLKIPLVYSSSGYDDVRTLKLLDGIIDIYRPEMRFGSNHSSLMISGHTDYVSINQAVVREMHRQVGDLTISHKGLAISGLMVRHSVLPGGLADTRGITQFLAEKISRNTYVHIMDDHVPSIEAARRHPELGRHLRADELESALNAVHAVGLHRLRKRPVAW